jgi:DNA-binding IclR family transcriptional regulator
MFGIDALLNIGGKLIDKLIPDPEAKAKAQLELAKLAQEGELARMANEVADLDSARKREMAVATSENAPYLNKIIVPVLAISILTATFALFGLVLFSDGVIDPNRKDIIIYVLGVLSAISTQIVAYYFGSSKGSADKTTSIDKILTK